MNPKRALKNSGWNVLTMNCRKTNQGWRLTYSDKCTVGEYTKNYLITTLKNLGYSVISSRIYPLPKHHIYAVGLWENDRSRLVLHIKE